MKREEIEELIASYLNGEASPEQAIDLEDWKSESFENQQLFEAYEKTHHALNDSDAFKSPDIENAWRKVEAQINQEAKVVPLFKNRRLYIAVAAIGLVALVISSLWRTDVNPVKPIVANDPTEDTTNVDREQIIYASNQVKSVTLQDQSIVELETGSKLTLAKDYNKNGRNAKLEGSGRFTVVHDESNPFILQVDEMDIYDVGTIFRVDTKDDTVKVAVDEGEVQLQLDSETIDLVAGDSAYYVISKKVMRRYKKFNARGQKVFVFNGETLTEVMKELSDFFGKKIEIMDEEIKNCRVSAEFPNESLGNILELLIELHGLEITSNNSKIEVYGKGCI